MHLVAHSSRNKLCQGGTQCWAEAGAPQPAQNVAIWGHGTCAKGGAFRRGANSVSSRSPLAHGRHEARPIDEPIKCQSDRT